MIRVIGLGAEERGDDAAGLLVARRLRLVTGTGVDVRECAGDAGSLLALLEGADHVVLVDAARGGTPGSVERVATATSGDPARSTHGLGLAEALGLAAALGILPAVVRLYAVHGQHFDLGPITPPVAAAIDVAAELILRDELVRV